MWNQIMLQKGKISAKSVINLAFDWLNSYLLFTICNINKSQEVDAKKVILQGYFLVYGINQQAQRFTQFLLSLPQKKMERLLNKQETPSKTAKGKDSFQT